MHSVPLRRIFEFPANPGGTDAPGRLLSRIDGPGFAPSVIPQTIARVGQRAAGLTERERAVVALVVLGQRNREIADELGISPETVKKHLSNVFQKLHVRHRVELVLLAARPELADLTQ